MEINILNCINNFNLSLFGIGITIFTVIFSFIFSKKGELDLLNNLLKQKDSIENSLRKGKAIDYIKKMRKINSHIILATIISLIIYIIINIYIIFRDEEAIHNQNNSIHPIYYIVIFLSVLNIAYFFILLIIFVHKYFKQTCLK